MDKSFRAGVLLFVGLALFATGIALDAVLAIANWPRVVAGAGALAALAGGFGLRAELVSFVQRRRGEITLLTIGVIGILLCLAWLSVRFPWRADMTEGGKYSLSKSTLTMLDQLDQPVQVTFFADPMMRETVDLYRLMAARTPKITVEVFDPTISPAQARLMGVQFAGTAVLRSEGRKVLVNGPNETDIANGILRVSRAATQRICFLDGHGEPDPFSMESHDHTEGDAGHSHGLGSKLMVHEVHGMAKARSALETMSYTVEKVSLMQSGTSLDKCAVMVVAGPRTPLLPGEVQAVRAFINAGGNALFMLDPFVVTGLEPVIRELGVILDNDLVIDDASHFWADPSSPAVTDYNRHQITRDLPLSFFPGARSLTPTAERVPNTSAMPLVNSSKRAYGETTPDRAEYDEGKDIPGPLTIMAVITRHFDSYDIADVATGAKPAADSAAKDTSTSAAAGAKPKSKSRIVVVGDSDFATNSFFHIMGNGNLFLNTINFLAAQENLIGIEPRTFDTPRVNLTNSQMKGTFFLSVILIPALLALVGMVVWWRQR